jgi:hypothetical protein
MVGIMFDYEKFIDSCEFGFELQQDGQYHACVKYPSEIVRIRMGIFSNKEYISRSIECDFISDSFVDYIENKFGRVYIDMYDVCFKSLNSVDCNKFARHRINYVNDKDIDELKSQGYTVTSWSNSEGDEIYNAEKYLSVEQYKSMLIDAIQKSIIKNKDVIANIQLFKTEGNKFVKCKV